MTHQKYRILPISKYKWIQVLQPPSVCQRWLPPFPPQENTHQFTLKLQEVPGLIQIWSSFFSLSLKGCFLNYHKFPDYLFRNNWSHEIFQRNLGKTKTISIFIFTGIELNDVSHVKKVSDKAFIPKTLNCDKKHMLLKFWVI